MKKIFIDTSVFIRFLTKDNPKKYEDCLLLLQLVSEGKIKPYISNIVIMELIFILDRHYNFPKSKVTDAIARLYLLRNLTVIEKTNTKIALGLYQKFNIKYGDCLIASQVKKGIILISYDEEFDKITNLSVRVPEDVIGGLTSG